PLDSGGRARPQCFNRPTSLASFAKVERRRRLVHIQQGEVVGVVLAELVISTVKESKVFQRIDGGRLQFRLEQHLRASLLKGRENLFLADKVVIERRSGKAELLGDRPHGDRGVAAGGVEAARGFENRRANYGRSNLSRAPLTLGVMPRGIGGPARGQLS